MAGKQLSIRVDPEIEVRLAELVRRTGRSRTFYIKEAILNHLEDLEDAYLGEKALEEFRKSGEKSISLDEVDWPD